VPDHGPERIRITATVYRCTVTRRPWLVSYRISLAVAIPLFVALAGGLILHRSQSATRAAIDGLVVALFREVSEQAASQARTHLGTAVPALRTLEAGGRGPVSAERDAALSRRLEAVLRANPGFAWVSYGDAEGAFLGMYRPEPTRVRENRSRVVRGPDGRVRTELDEADVDAGGRRTPIKHVEDSGYDPRERDFFRAAAAKKELVWIRPYVFAGQGVAGITAALPHVDDTGRVLGVYTVDFDLAALSRFVASLRLSPHGEVFVFTEQGDLVAHPRLSVVAKGDADGILHLDEALLPSLVAFREGLAERQRRDGSFRMHVEGEPWFASVTRFEMEGGLVWYVGAVAPESDFTEEVERARRGTLLVGAGLHAVAMLLAWGIASRIVRPLGAIVTDMESVGRFELAAAATKESRFEEIAKMQRALVQMKSGLASFARFVPRDLVRALVASGGEAKLGGETRELTVFFSDIAGFTTLAEALPPDVLVDKLGAYLDAMTRTIAAEGGTVDKFLCDGILAFWGAPAEDARHAARACVAALLCQRTLAELQARPEGEWLKGTRTRIGLATGPVLVGNVGTPERLNYTVMGDVVNLTARLESLNKQYGSSVMASEPTVRAAGDVVVARPLDVVAVKGKAKAVRVYELLALADDPGAGDARRLAAACASAMDAYLARDFAGAAAAWRAVLAERPDDAAARVLLSRAEAYAKTPPPPDWDGSWAATSK
jgi:adenylate cyclase